MRRALQGRAAALAVSLASVAVAPGAASSAELERGLAAPEQPRTLAAPPVEPRASAVAEPDASARPQVRWREEWPRVRPWQYAGTAALLGTAFTLRLAGPQPPDNWRGGLLFDDAVLDAVFIEGAAAARVVETVSDVLFYSAMGYRLIDSALVPLVGYGDADLALQLSMIDLSAFSVQAIVLWGSQVFLGRTRPIVERCEALPAEALGRCAVPSRLGERRSFIAGHAATSLTAAGLTCLHHSRLPLYGGWGDTAACAASLVAAGVNGLARVVDGYHYPTDLLFATALGVLSGWVVPAALHYGFGSSELESRSSDHATGGWSGVRAAVVPYVQPDQVGALLHGAF